MMASGTQHAPTTADQHDATEARSLAEALTHLLARDDEPPARWLAPAFADAVGRARAEQHADAWGHGLVHAFVAAAPLTFHAAVARLARDPRSVAVAIRHLEIAGARRLPPWPDLIRRHMPTAPTGFDASLWFG
jgi:hypothetical protein